MPELTSPGNELHTLITAPTSPLAGLECLAAQSLFSEPFVNPIFLCTYLSLINKQVDKRESLLLIMVVNLA